MIFWTTWMFAFVAGVVCVATAMERPSRQFGWLSAGYFCMVSGVVASVLGVPL